MRRPVLLLLCFCLCLAAAGCAAFPSSEPATDPYAGLVRVADGRGGEYWVKDYESLPVMSLSASAFVPDGEYINYIGTDAVCLRGVDVSEHQGEIDWSAAAADGLDFAIVRAGYRGWSLGGVFEDLCFRQNVEGALKSGLRVGAYFFSQARTPDEAREEARFLLERVADYEISLPLFYDWERIDSGPARTDGMTGAETTDCALAFAEEIAAAGYTPGVYFYRDLGYRFYELDRLASLTFWAAAPGETPDFHYKHEFWQYSFTARVAGVEGDCDLDLYFIYPAPEETPGEEEQP